MTTMTTPPESTPAPAPQVPAAPERPVLTLAPGTKAAAAEVDEDDDTEFEKAVVKARTFLAASGNGGQLVLFNEIVALMKITRREHAVTAANVDAVIEHFEDEETLAEHAEEFVPQVASLILELVTAANFVDKEKGWTGPVELGEKFKKVDQLIVDFNVHVAKTVLIQREEEAADANAAVEAAAPGLASVALGGTDDEGDTDDVDKY